MPYVMVLNDGETFTDLDGCRLIAINYEMLSYGIQGHGDLDSCIKDFCRGEGVTGLSLVTEFGGHKS